MVELASTTKDTLLKIANKRNRTIIFIALIVTIIAEDFIIYCTSINGKFNYTNYILIFNSSIAAGFALFLLSKQRFDKVRARIHAAVAIGLTLWLCANITWTIYENMFEVLPVLSIADCFWLAAYPFFAYSLYMTCKEFYKKLHSKKVVLTVLCSSITFIVCIVPFTFNLFNLSVFETPRGIAMFSVLIAYPILNTILIVPAITLLKVFRKEKDWSVPWICESLSLLSLIVADSWFAIIFLTHLTKQIWYSSFFLIDHYLVISAGLIWSIKFLIPANNKEYIPKPVMNRKSAFKIPKRMPFIAFIIPIVIISSILVNSTFESLFHVNPNVLGSVSNNNTKVIKIGALLGWTGISSQRGESQKAAMEIAEKDVNDYFSNINSSTRIKLIFQDTQRKLDVALEKLESLKHEGIRIVIGPQTSAELNITKDYANQNNILLISHSSTAMSLAIPNDNVFRLVRNDSIQADALAKQMWKDGISIAVPIWRDDVWGKDLHTLTKNKLEEMAVLVFDGIGYEPPVGKFASSLHRINFIMWDQVLNVLRSQVNDAKSSYPTLKVGVYIISYDEIVPILIEAQNYRVLANVSWYGSDGSAKNERILKNVEAAQFAIKTGFPNPLSEVEENCNVTKLGNVTKLENDIEKKIGRHPDPYSANAYDAVWVAALTENASKGIQDIQIIKQNLSQISNSHFGLTGNLSLNEDGDRNDGIYDFWRIKQKGDNSGYEWEKDKNSSSNQLPGKMC